MADRRQILVFLGAAVATSAFAWLHRKRTRRSFSAPPVRRARVAVVGCGGWTQGWHLPNLANRDDVDIVALVEPSDEPGTGGCMTGRCEPMSALVERYGARRYRSLDALLDDKQEELDGILIAAPHALHCSLGLAVLRAGLHLLLEKPMTSDIKEARALFDASAAAPALAFLLNNTANWQPVCVQARSMVAAGKLGAVRAVSCVFAAPLGWLFEGEEHVGWSKPTGSMLGNGFGWGQLSHTFAWVFAVTGLTPATVYAAACHSATTGADLHESLTVTCTCGAIISATGVGACPDAGFKVVSHWVFGTEGMLSFGGLAGSDGAGPAAAGDGSAPARGVAAAARRQARTAQLLLWRHDGAHEAGAPFAFESLDPSGRGPGSLDAFVRACRGEPFYCGAGATEGLKTVATIEALYRSLRSGQPERVSGCHGL